MAQSVTSPTLTSTRPAAAVPAGDRMAFIDNLRWLVIGMVVIMHACVTYSGLGSWYYKEPSTLGVASTLVFSVYQSFAQAFFMGMLFLIAAYFIPRAYDRKGFGRFVRDRLFRLGVPTLVYMLILNPLTDLLAQASRGQAIGSPLPSGCPCGSFSEAWAALSPGPWTRSAAGFTGRRPATPCGNPSSACQSASGSSRCTASA